VCVPAYNEVKHIENIVRDAKPYCTEMIVCDDWSVDNTGGLAHAAGATVIRHESSRGMVLQSGRYSTMLKSKVQTL